MSELQELITGFCMQELILKCNASWPNLVAHFLQTGQSVKSVFLPDPPKLTYKITSHTNRSLWHIESIVLSIMRQMLSTINRTRAELRCSFGTTISHSATSSSSAKSYGINIQARRRPIIVRWEAVVSEGSAALEKRLEWG